MNGGTRTGIALLTRQAKAIRPHLAVEQLENRTLPSVNLVETEPNDTRAHANVIPHVLDTPVHVSGKVASRGDSDWFAIQLDQGDVVGATLTGPNGLNPALHMVNATGDLMIANDDSQNIGAGVLPHESPLPHENIALTDAAIYYVINSPGTYYLAVSSSEEASTGNYKLDMMVARPGLEARPVGTQQILYLDFDGARVNFNHFAEPIFHGHGQRTLSPMSNFLTGWGLTAADENAVIDKVVAQVKDKLSAYLKANGLNGDFATTGIPGQFGIEIRNSRDNPDEFGSNPLMSRVVVGGTEAEAGFVEFNLLGQAQDVDLGNFKTDDEAVATLDFIAIGLALIPIQPPATTIDFVATGIAALVAHEAGHLFGAFHTDQVPTDPYVGTLGLMDPFPISALVGAIGPDFVFGSDDDRTLQLSVEGYYGGEPFRGLDDTLNTVAFGLSTGKASAFHADAVGSTSAVRSLQSMQIKPLLSEAIARWQATGIDTSGLANLQIRIADLGGTTLGLISGNTITLDDNAAGWGWFADATPHDDSEFTTPGNQGEQGRMDLLTVLMHEIGHVLGHEHDEGGVMAETLTAGMRLAPPVDATDWLAAVDLAFSKKSSSQWRGC